MMPTAPTLLIVTLLLVGCVAPAEPPEVSPRPEPRLSIPRATRTSVPLIGGTLRVLRDGTTVVAADPQGGNLLWIDAEHVNLIDVQPLHDKRAMPTRMVDDDAGRLHVLLRGQGAVATFDTTHRALLAQRRVCASVRDVAWEASRDQLWITCAGGALVVLDARTLDEVRVTWLERDLRDVVIVDDVVFVSRHVSAELLVLSLDGELLARRTPAHLESSCLVGNRLRARYAPRVASRLIADVRDRGVVMVHQYASMRRLELNAAGGYEGSESCKQPAIKQALTRFQLAATRPALTGMTIEQTDKLPVQLDALLRDVGDGEVDLLLAASGARRHSGVARMWRFETRGEAGPVRFGSSEEHDDFLEPPVGAVVALAETARGVLVTQTQQPLRVMVGRVEVPLEHAVPVLEREHYRGARLFYKDAGAGIACASCHPDGLDDGHAWRIEGLGLRRTQSLAGGMLGTAPFHWDAEFVGLGHLMDDVFVERMGGAPPSAEGIIEMGTWLDGLEAPSLRLAHTDALIARGQTIFERSGCAGCHRGPQWTDNRSHLLGDASVALQTPSLRGVGLRAPYTHNGCAPTLRARFQGPACTIDPAHTIVEGDLDALVAYLETL